MGKEKGVQHLGKKNAIISLGNCFFFHDNRMNVELKILT